MRKIIKKITIIVFIISIILISYKDNVFSMLINEQLYDCKIYFDTNRFSYDGKEHKPIISIIGDDGKNYTNKYHIKFSNPNSYKIGKYKVTITENPWDEYPIVAEYEIVKGPKTTSKAIKEIKKFFKKAVKCAKSNLKSLDKNFCDEKGVLGKVSRYDKKIIKKRNKTYLKIKYKKLKISKNKLSASVKLEIRHYSYEKAVEKTPALCYKDALKHNYVETMEGMKRYHYNKNLKKAMKKYQPKRVKGKIRLYMIKTSKGWRITEDDYEKKNGHYKSNVDGIFRFINYLTCNLY